MPRKSKAIRDRAAKAERARAFRWGKKEEERVPNFSEVNIKVKVQDDHSEGVNQVPPVEVRHCLFCYEVVEGDNYFTRRESDNLEGNFTTMFILTKMLSVPREKLEEYLKSLGNPGGWVVLCRKCRVLVEEAVRIQKEIGRLESFLRKCQEGMISKIWETWKEGESDSSSSASMIAQLTQETRNLVSERRPESKEVLQVPIPHAPEEDDNYFEEPEHSPPSHPSDRIGDMTDIDEVEALASGNYRCHLCPSVKEMTASRVISLVLFHFNKPLKCSQCGVYYSSESDLLCRPYIKQSGDAHQCSGNDLISVKYEPVNLFFWKCALCRESFNTESERDLHEKQVHEQDDLPVPQKKHQCSWCSTSFQNLAEWRFHRVLEHPEVAAFSCYYCDLSFKSKTKQGTEYFDEEEMISHVRQDHKSLQPPSVIPRLPDECLLCGDVFPVDPTCKELHHHLETVHGVSSNDSYACPGCSLRKPKRPQVWCHFNAEHRVNKKVNRSMRFCDICGFQGRGKLVFDEHNFTKHGILPESRQILKCSKVDCSFECVNKQKLNRHLMKEHGAERKHKCKICGKGFLNATHCREHEEIHLNAGLKPYQCEICGNSFAIKNYLYIHKRLSHQNRPFASTHKKKPPRKKISPGGQLPSSDVSTVNNI